MPTLNASGGRSKLSYFDSIIIIFFVVVISCVALINEEAGAADLRTSTSVPLSVGRCGKSMSSDPLVPPPLVLIRDERSGSSGSRGLSPPLTTVRPNSTLITLTPRHIPVQSLRSLCREDLAGELRERTERREAYFSPGALNTQLQVW